MPAPLEWLWRCLPAGFRKRHGRALRETIADVWERRLARAGRGSRLLYWARTAGSLMVLAVQLRLGARRTERMRGDRDRKRRSGRAAGFGQDLRYAAASVRRRPGFALLVTGTLALGLGASTAVYGLVNTVLLNPVPVERAREVVAVFEAVGRNAGYGGTAYPNYRDYRDRTRTLRSLAAFGELDAGLVAGEATARISLGVVSGNYFQVLGLRPALGRLFQHADEAAPGATPYVVLSHELWRSRFAQDAGVIGRTVRLNGAVFEVTGVAPRGFRGTQLGSAPAAWIPVTMVQAVGAGGLYSANVLETRHFQWLKMVGRVRPGATVLGVERELNRIAADVRAEQPDAFPNTIADPIRVASIADGATIGSRTELLRFLGLLAAVALLTLLIACLNVANLMIARGLERMRELGVRAALGASRARLVRQLFLESLLLAVLAAAAALLVGVATIALIRSFTLPGDIELATLRLELNVPLLAFSMVAALAAVIGFGLLPAVRTTRGNLAHGLLAGGARFSPRRARARAVLVSVQVALSLMLLVSGALVLRSLVAALRTDLGFDPRGVAALSFGLRQHGYDADRANAFFELLLDDVKRRPGILAVALGTHVPVSGQRLGLPITVESPSGVSRTTSGFTPIAAEYFDVLGVPLIDGRRLSPADEAADAPLAAIANQTAAQQFWPGANPLGQSIELFGGKRITVVGVVRDTRYHSVAPEDRPYFFVPAARFSDLLVLDRMSLLARGDGNAGVTLRTLRDAVAALDPTLPVFDERLVHEQIDRVLMPQRFALRLLGAFGTLALIISAVGIYGLVTYTVAQRTQEIGIRIALGALRRDIIAVVARDTALAGLLGLVLGVAGSLAASKLLVSFLYETAPTDPLAILAAGSLLAAAGLAAALLPARRALRTDPLTALHQ